MSLGETKEQERSEITIIHEDGERTELLAWVRDVGGQASSAEDRSALIAWLLDETRYTDNRCVSSSYPVVADTINVVRTLGTAEDAVVRLARNPTIATLSLWSSVAVVMCNHIFYVLVGLLWWQEGLRLHVKTSLGMLCGLRLVEMLFFYWVESSRDVRESLAKVRRESYGLKTSALVESHHVARSEAIRAALEVEGADAGEDEEQGLNVVDCCCFEVACDGFTCLSLLYNEEDAEFRPLFGCFLTLSGLRLPAVALVQSHKIADCGVTVEDIERPSDALAESGMNVFVQGRNAMTMIRLFEMVFQSGWMLLVSWEVYTRQRMSKLEGNDWRLWLSCATSVFALAYGVAFTYLNEEGFVVRFLVCLYLFLFAVARFTMHAVIFVEFGAYGWYFTAYVFAVRVLVMVCRASRVGAGSKENVRDSDLRAETRVTRNLVWWEYIGFGTADAFLTFLLPLGTRDSRPMLAFLGMARTPTFTDKFLSPHALLMLALHLLEFGVEWLAVRVRGGEAAKGFVFYGPGTLGVALGVLVLAMLLHSEQRLKLGVSLRWLCQQCGLAGEHHVLTALHHLAEHYKSTNRYRKAYDIHRDNSARRLALHGAEHKETLVSKNATAETLKLLGDLNAAVDESWATLKLRKAALGDRDAHTLESADALVGLLITLGHFDEAMPLCFATFQLRKKLQLESAQSASQSTGRLLEMLDTGFNFALLLLENGTYEEAVLLFRRIWSVRSCRLGSIHPSTLKSVEALSNCLRLMGKYDEAGDIAREAFDMCKIKLGKDHADTLAIQGQLAQLLFEKGDDMEAADLLIAAHAARTEMLGEDHPDTLRAAHDLDHILFHQQTAALVPMADADGDGDPQEAMRMDSAEKVFRKTHEQRLKNFGSVHPETLESANELASLLFEKGLQTGDANELAKAEEIYAKTLELRLKKLGVAHPDSLRSAHNLDNLLESSPGRDHEAYRLYEMVQSLFDAPADGAERVRNKGADAVREAVLERMMPYLRRLIQGFDSEHSSAYVELMNDGGITIEPFEVNQQTLVVLLGGSTFFRNCRVGKCELTLPTRSCSAKLDIERLEVEMHAFPSMCPKRECVKIIQEIVNAHKGDAVGRWRTKGERRPRKDCRFEMYHFLEGPKALAIILTLTAVCLIFQLLHVVKCGSRDRCLPTAEENQAVEIFEFWVAMAFATEIFLRIICYQFVHGRVCPDFFKSPMNLIDTVVVLFDICLLALENGSKLSYVFRFCRIFKAFQKGSKIGKIHRGVRGARVLRVLDAMRQAKVDNKMQELKDALQTLSGFDLVGNLLEEATIRVQDVRVKYADADETAMDAHKRGTPPAAHESDHVIECEDLIFAHIECLPIHVRDTGGDLLHGRRSIQFVSAQNLRMSKAAHKRQADDAAPPPPAPFEAYITVTRKASNGELLDVDVDVALPPEMAGWLPTREGECSLLVHTKASHSHFTHRTNFIPDHDPKWFTKAVKDAQSSLIWGTLFQQLGTDLKQWSTLFEMFDEDLSKTLSFHELRQLLIHAAGVPFPKSEFIRLQHVIGKEPDEEIPLADMLHFVKQMMDNEESEIEKYNLNHKTRRPRPKARTRRVKAAAHAAHVAASPTPSTAAKKTRQAAASAERVSLMQQIFGPLLSILFHDDGGKAIEEFVEFTETGFRMKTDKDGRGFKIHPSSFATLTGGSSSFEAEVSHLEVSVPDEALKRPSFLGTAPASELGEPVRITIKNLEIDHLPHAEFAEQATMEEFTNAMKLIGAKFHNPEHFTRVADSVEVFVDFARINVLEFCDELGEERRVSHVLRLNKVQVLNVNVFGEDSQMFRKHKTVMIGQCSLAYVDFNGKLTDTMRPLPIGCDLTLSRRKSDSTLINVDCAIDIPEIAAFIIGGLPDSTRMRVKSHLMKPHRAAAYGRALHAWAKKSTPMGLLTRTLEDAADAQLAADAAVGERRRTRTTTFD